MPNHLREANHREQYLAGRAAQPHRRQGPAVSLTIERHEDGVYSAFVIFADERPGQRAASASLRDVLGFAAKALA